MTVSPNNVFREKISWISNVFLSRVFVFYIIIFLVSLRFIDYADIKMKFSIETLNRYKPSSHKYLFDISENSQEIDRRALGQFLRYYQKVAELIPTRSDAYAMQAFCYFYLKDYDKSISNFRKAITIDPEVFTYSYNLGMVYYKTGNYQKALRMFKEAIKRKPEHLFLFYSSSKIYLKLLAETGLKKKAASEIKVKQDYRDCYLWLILTYYQLGRYQEVFDNSVFMTGATESINEFYYFAGVGGYLVKDYKKAINYLQLYVRKFPQYTKAAEYLVMSLRGIGQGELAEKMFNLIQKTGKLLDPIDIMNNNIHLKVL